MKLADYGQMLTPKQKKRLRARAHELRPVLIIGNAGLVPNTLNALEEALEHHELVKIRINATDRKQVVETLVSRSGAEKIQEIGKVLVLYRRNPERPKNQADYS